MFSEPETCKSVFKFTIIAAILCYGITFISSYLGYSLGYNKFVFLAIAGLELCIAEYSISKLIYWYCNIDYKKRYDKDLNTLPFEITTLFTILIISSITIWSFGVDIKITISHDFIAIFEIVSVMIIIGFICCKVVEGVDKYLNNKVLK